MVDGDILLLALEDILPVALSAVGFVVLTRTSRRLDGRAAGHVAAGALLIVAGGLTKPVFKLLLAFGAIEADMLWLDDALFWLLAPGFLIASAGLWRAGRRDLSRPVGSGRWGVIGAVAVLAVATGAAFAGSEAWFFVLLTVATVGNVLAISALVWWARGRGDLVAAMLFTANQVLVFGLAGAAAVLEQTFAAQLGEQLVSTVAQAMFMWASIRLAAAVSPGSRPAARETATAQTSGG